MVRPITLFADGESAAEERLGVGVQCLGIEQQTEMVHQRGRRLGDAGGVGV
jgi:hypothetical protein